MVMSRRGARGQDGLTVSCKATQLSSTQTPAQMTDRKGHSQVTQTQTDSDRRLQ